MLSCTITLKPLPKQKIRFIQLYWFSYRKTRFRNMTFRYLQTSETSQQTITISTAILDTRLVFMLSYRGLPEWSTNILCCVSTTLCCVSAILCCVSTTLCCVSIILCCVSVILCCVSTILCCVSIILCCVSINLCCVSTILCCVSIILCCVSLN